MFDIQIEVKETGRNAPKWKLEGDLEGELTLEAFFRFMQIQLADLALDVLTEEQQKGFDKSPVIRVDKRLGKPVSQVKAFGEIEITARRQVNDIALKIFTLIDERSPERTGLYRKSNVVFLNKTKVATDFASLKAWTATNPELKEGDLITFINTQPYARKLERYAIHRGTQSGAKKSPKVRKRKSKDQRAIRLGGGKVNAPNGAYYLASRAALRLFKTNAKIAFRYIPGYVFGFSGVFRGASNGRPGRRTSRKPKRASTYLYPAIVVRIGGAGLL